LRYTHGFKLIRSRTHRAKISVAITGVLVILIIFLGFTALDAGRFFLGFFESFIRVLVAYLIALIVASTLALVATSSKTLEGVFIPILDALQSFPSFALSPLLIIWFGKSSTVVVIILVIEMIWPIIFTLLSGQKQLKEDLLEAAEVFGARGFKYFTEVLIPLLFPSIVTGSIVAWGEAWETIIAAEIIVNVPGVGSYLSASGEDLQSKVLVVGIILLLAILFLLNKYIWLPLLNFSTKYQQE